MLEGLYACPLEWAWECLGIIVGPLDAYSESAVRGMLFSNEGKGWEWCAEYFKLSRRGGWNEWRRESELSE